MPGASMSPNLSPAQPSTTGATQPIEAPTSDRSSTSSTNSGTAIVPVSAPASNKRRRDLMQHDIAGCDHRNNLKHSELIDLVVNFQEQNLILTRESNHTAKITAKTELATLEARASILRILIFAGLNLTLASCNRYNLDSKPYF